MHSGHIIGATRSLGAPENWDKTKRGACASLYVRDEETIAGPAMTSAWYPTSEEIRRIVAGAPIYLSIFGAMHPPVSMAVGPEPEAS